MKLFAAFLIAPLTCSIAILICSILCNGSGGIWLFSFITAIAYSLTITVGLPVYFLMKKRNKTSLVAYLNVGAGISILPIGYFILIPILNTVTIDDSGLLPRILQIVIILFSCLLTTASFWLIARPDKLNRVRKMNRIKE